MAQFYIIANLDKKQVLRPHKFKEGAKLSEFARSRGGSMLGLAILLAIGNGRGAGDIKSNSSVIGSWVGNRIAIIGDFVETDEFEAVYDDEEWEDVSDRVLEVIQEDNTNCNRDNV